MKPRRARSSFGVPDHWTDPEGGWVAPQGAAGEEPGQLIRETSGESLGPEEHIKLTVESKECLEQVLLLPEEAGLFHELPWGLPGRVAVTGVDQTSRSDAWEDLQDDPIDLTAEFHCVGGVDEEQISLAQALKVFEWN